MIGPEFMNEAQALDRDDKLAIIRLLQSDIVDDSSESDDLLEAKRTVRYIPPIRASAETMERFEALARVSIADG